MSPDEIREPRTGRLVLFGLCLLGGAGFLVFTGISSRAKNERDLETWTRERAVPTVAVVQPQRGAAERTLTLPGNIEAFTTAPIYARASGYVRAWHKDIGETVRKGEVLAEIDTPDLDQQYAQAKAELTNAEVAAKLAATTAKRYASLVTQSIVSQQTNDERATDASAKQAALESSRANLARLEALVAFKTLVAPFDGIVITRNIDVGALINGGGTTGLALFQVADIKKMRVYVRVPQAFTAELEPGLEATLDLPQYPGRHFEASLVGTSNSIAAESRTALVQLQADNADGKLWPGTFAEVRFHLKTKGDVLQIPTTALIFGERGLEVATVDDESKLALKKVQVGKDVGSSIEVLSGIALNDRVVDSPLETFRTGDKVDVAPSKTPPAKVAAGREKSTTD